MRAILSLTLAILITVSAPLSALADGGSVTYLVPPGTESAPASGEAALPDAQVQDVDWSDMSYEHYDTSYFFMGVDQLEELAAGDDAEAVIELYDKLYQQFLHIETLNSIAYVHASQDVMDSYWSAENQYSEAITYDAADALSTACYLVTTGPCAAAFAEHVGRDAFDTFAAYVPMTDREAELLEQESALIDQYYQRMNERSSITYSYLGEAWTLEMLNGFQGASLSTRDYDGYLEVYYGLQKAVNDAVGPIFLELVHLRAEIAQLEGWDSYAAMAYENTYGRDYSLEDAQMLCDAVKPVARVFNERLCYSSLRYSGDSVSPILDPEQILDILRQYVTQLDPALARPLDFMIDHGLYDFAGGASRSPSNYTISLDQYDSAFIFATPDSTYNGLATVCHEFGHFASDYYSTTPNLLTSTACFDVMEIHSTGLETLFTEFYDQIFDTGADVARFNVLVQLLEALAEGCIFDEFQRRIYAQPDMTLDEMNKLFAAICIEYGQYEPTNVDYNWIYVPHTFESPMYYLSYAASALATIQIWDMAQTDLWAAVDTWKAVLTCDPYTERYDAVLSRCGLRLFSEPGAVAAVCQPLVDELIRLDAGA